jgi:hypothetical protein
VAKAEGASGGERAQTPGAEHLADSRVLAPAAEVVKAPIAPLREPQRRIAMPPAPTAKPPAAPVEEPKTLCELFHEKVAPLKASATATLACANEKAGAAFDCASKKIEVFCNQTLGFDVVQQGAQYIFVKV